MTFKLFFIGCLFIGPLLSWSQSLSHSYLNVQGIMESKTFAKFVLSHNNCSFSISREVLKETSRSRVMNDYIESNWEAGQKLSVAVPVGAVRDDSECLGEDVAPLRGLERQIADVSYIKDESSIDERGSGDFSSPSYACSDPDYLALKARVEDYNSKNQDGNSMPIPPCTGGNRNIPECGSEEHREEEREARRTGSPIGPCRGGQQSQRDLPECGSEEHQRLEREINGPDEPGVIRHRVHVECRKRGNEGSR